MPSPIIVQFNVQPYLRKFLIYESENKAEPLEFKRMHHFEMLLLPRLISNYRYRHELITDAHDTTGMVPTSIRLHYRRSVNGFLDFRYNHYLSPENERCFRNELDHFFKVHMTTFVHRNRLKAGCKRYDAIRLWMDELMIDDDEVNFESLYRYYTRATEVKIVNKS